MPTKTCWAENCGSLRHPGVLGTYANCHDAAESNEAHNDSDEIQLGQYFNGTDRYSVYRGTLEFDIAGWSIPTTSAISAASIFLKCKSGEDLSAIDFDVVLLCGDDIAGIVVAADYGDLLDETVSRGAVNTSGIVEEDYIEIVLNAIGIAAVQAALTAGVYVRFGLRSSRDISETAPTGDGSSTYYEDVTFYGMEYGDYDEPNPYLYITYTLVSAPTATTNPATSVGETTSARLNGALADDGGEACACGFEYGLDTGYGTTTPTESKETSETFSQDITGLSANTLYHFRAIATNSAGAGYGSDRTFIICSVDGAVFATQAELDAYMAAQSPTVTTQAMTDVEPTTATGNGNATDLGGENLTQHGHCWSTSHNPTTSDNKTELGAKSETGAFTSSLTSLTPNTLYYCRAYATNDYGTSYGDEVTFTTEVDMAEVTTNEATNVKETSATLNGTLVDDGGEACDVRFQYGFTTSYGTNTDWQSGKETAETFSQSIAELVGGTLYHFRAQARNSASTVNGNDRALTTITPFVAKRAHSLAREEL